MALPGFFYIDKTGVVREKYFEASYVDRFTPNNVIAKLFPELTEEASSKVEAPHLELALAQSDRTVVPGSRVSLFVDVALPPETHVYAPGVVGYKPIALIVQPSGEIEVAAAGYPEAKTLYLDAVKEKVSVFEGKFRIVQDVKIVPSKALIQSLGSIGKTIHLVGELRYQACDRMVCYRPTSVPVSWQLQVLPLDTQRSPEAIRHRE